MSPQSPHPSPTPNPGHDNATHTHTHKAVSCTQGHRGCTHNNIEKIYIIYNTPGALVPPPGPITQPQAGCGGRGRAVGPQDSEVEEERGPQRKGKWRSGDPRSEMEVEARRLKEQQGRPSRRCQGGQPPADRTAARSHPCPAMAIDAPSQYRAGLVGGDRHGGGKGDAKAARVPHPPRVAQEQPGKDRPQAGRVEGKAGAVPGGPPGSRDRRSACSDEPPLFSISPLSERPSLLPSWVSVSHQGRLLSCSLAGAWPQ